MIEVFGRNWGLVLMRGIAALACGIYIIVVHPFIGLVLWVLLFGWFSVVKGVFVAIVSFLTHRHEPTWLEFIIDGPLRIAVGIITLTWPDMNVATLLRIIGAWACIRGVSHMVTAVQVRKLLRGAWLLHIAGALSIIFGILLYTFVDNQLVEIIGWIGWCLTLFGITWITFAFVLRSWLHQNRADLDRRHTAV